MGAKVAFSPKEFLPFEVTDIVEQSHDTKMFRVKLPSPEHEMGMTTASLLMLQGASEDVARPYTPTTLNSQKGYFELVIKKYPDGAVSSYMHGLKPGDKIKVKGPFQKLVIKPNMKKAIGMIAGGTGLTPMYQCVLELLQSEEDKTDLTLVYANKTSKDILIKDDLDKLARENPRFKVHYIIDKEEPGWTGGVGHVTLDDVKKYMPEPSDDNLVFVCGPPGMYKAISGPKAEDKSQGEIGGYLKEAGYTSDQVFKF
jgi:cytochrome-b5 reductase